MKFGQLKPCVQWLAIGSLMTLLVLEYLSRSFKIPIPIMILKNIVKIAIMIITHILAVKI